jgi:lambda family phage portal protein
MAPRKSTTSTSASKPATPRSSAKKPTASKSAASAAPKDSSTKTKTVRRRNVHGRNVRGADPFGLSGFNSAKTFFEAASKSRRLESAVDAGPNSANGEIEYVRMRSRWTYANDSFYRNCCKQIANNAVSYGIKPIIKDKRLLKLWKRWSKEADVRGRLNFYAIQHALGSTVPRDGEALVRFRERRPEDMRSGVPFQLQLMEADHLPLSYTQIGPNGNRITSGVELDAIERVTRYWLYEFHPKDLWQGTAGSLVPKPVPAHEIMHIFAPDRFTGTRGYPWGASSLNTSESLRSYEMFELERKKGQAGFLGVLKKPRLANDDDGSVQGAQSDDEDEDDVVVAPMEPNTVMVVPDDYDFELEQPTATDSNYVPYRREAMAGMAVAMGLAVEHVSMNWQFLNERQARIVLNEVMRFIFAIQDHMLIHQFCEPVMRRFISAVVLNDLWELPEGMDIEDVLDEIEWMPPARGYINPLQEAQADKERITSGLDSRKRVAASNGWDVEDIDDDNWGDQERARGRGLAYTSYPALAAPGAMGSLLGAMEQYGVAVRAGAITPQADDEAAFRKALGLPAMGKEVEEYWKKAGGIKQPITLAAAEEALGQDPSAQPPTPDANPAQPADDSGSDDDY